MSYIWDWNSAWLPSGYDMSTLFTKIQQGLQTLDPALTINTVVASGDLYTLSINEADAEARYKIFDEDERTCSNFQSSIKRNNLRHLSEKYSALQP